MTFLPRLRPVWSAAVSARPRLVLAAPYSTTEPIKKKTPPAGLAPEAEQSMARGGFYDYMIDFRLPQPNHFPRDVPATTAPEEKTPEPKPKQDQEPRTGTPLTGTEMKPKIEPKAEHPEKEKPLQKPNKAKSRKRKQQQEQQSNEDTSKDSSGGPVRTTTTPSEDTSQIETQRRGDHGTDTSAAEEKARVVFGSSLAGPYRRAERIADMRDRSRNVAGVLVPPQPEEPDNCCMSGCVNCVWEQYREDMEMWAEAEAEAQRRLAARAETQRTKQQQQQRQQHLAASMDDDGGGSETNWNLEEPPKLSKDLWQEDLYRNVPVGIREFMKQEKRIKERQERSRDG